MCWYTRRNVYLFYFGSQDPTPGVGLYSPGTDDKKKKGWEVPNDDEQEHMTLW